MTAVTIKPQDIRTFVITYATKDQDEAFLQ